MRRAGEGGAAARLLGYASRALWEKASANLAVGAQKVGLDMLSELCKEQGDDGVEQHRVLYIRLQLLPLSLG